MKIVDLAIQMAMNESAIRLLAQNLAAAVEQPVYSLHYVVFVPSMRYGGLALYMDKTFRNLPFAFVERDGGFKTPYAWEIVAFDPSTHQPLAMTRSEPTD